MMSPFAFFFFLTLWSASMSKSLWPCFWLNFKIFNWYFPLVILEWISGILMKQQISLPILWKNPWISPQMKTFMGKRDMIPAHCNYWAHVPQLLKPACSRARVPQLLSPHAATTETHTPRAHAPQQEKPPQWEAHVPQQRVAPARRN